MKSSAPRMLLRSTILALSFVTAASYAAPTSAALTQEEFETAALRGEAATIQNALPLFSGNQEALEKALALASLRGHEAVATIILDAPNSPVDLNKKDARYLAYAARAGHLGVMEKLIKAGARDDDGFAVASAIDGEKKSSFDFLIDVANISANAGNGMVMSMAMTANDTHYVRRLLEKNADVKTFPIIQETLDQLRKDQAEGRSTSATAEIIGLIEQARGKAVTADKKNLPALAPS